MASRARIDERGRVMISRADREAALFPPRSDVLVVPKSPGHIELILVGEGRLELFQKKIRGRLRNWREEEHRADRLLDQLASQRTQETKPRRHKE
jgi:hypothetical protein